MMIGFIQFRNWIIALLYRIFAKPVFFLLDPETVHDGVSGFAKFLGRHASTKALANLAFNFKNSSLGQNILGINFSSPIGLAAGFDKDAQLTDILPAVGFGFAEVGSITGEPCSGNKRPRLWRLKESKSLLVYYGLKNEGCEAIVSRLSQKQFSIPIGISIAKTNSPQTVDEAAGIADYVKAYKTFAQRGIGDYYTINISCPNAFGGEPFVEPSKLNWLLGALKGVGFSKPIFLKMPAELDYPAVDEIIKLGRNYGVGGFICSNLAKSRDNDRLANKNVMSQGGMSGKVVEELSNRQIAYIYKQTESEFIIIGCGGVFGPEDAYKKIKLGASLIQLITGMIFKGPQLISQINLGLVKLLKQDGFSNISQAIGSGNK